MNSGTGGIDLIKIQAVRECLERHFLDVKFSQTTRPTFTFHNGTPKLSSLLVMNADFLADCKSIEELRHFVEEKVLKKILQNPGKRIQISKYHDITVEEKNWS